jgi:hypothetical protein
MPARADCRYHVSTIHSARQEGAVRPRDDGNLSLRALAGPIERLAQVNIALILAQAVIIRLTVELASASAGNTDPLVLLGFLGVCGVAGYIVIMLSRTIRRFPRRWLRIAIALGSVLLQATAFQVIHSWAG